MQLYNNHMNRALRGGETMTKSYARQAPRGFRNETVIHEFPDAAKRDAWVKRHYGDGDMNSAMCGARECTRKEAMEILHRYGGKGTLTENHNELVEHDDYCGVCGEERIIDGSCACPNSAWR